MPHFELIGLREVTEKLISVDPAVLYTKLLRVVGYVSVDEIYELSSDGVYNWDIFERYYKEIGLSYADNKNFIKHLDPNVLMKVILNCTENYEINELVKKRKIYFEKNILNIASQIQLSTTKLEDLRHKAQTLKLQCRKSYFDKDFHLRSLMSAIFSDILFFE
jgi:hypothetical protein